jgi:hypothetical protein
MPVRKADIKATLREFSRATLEPATAAVDEIWAALERRLA